MANVNSRVVLRQVSRTHTVDNAACANCASGHMICHVTCCNLICKNSSCFNCYTSCDIVEDYTRSVQQDNVINCNTMITSNDSTNDYQYKFFCSNCLNDNGVVCIRRLSHMQASCNEKTKDGFNCQNCMKTDLLVGIKCSGNNNSHELCQTDLNQFLEVASLQLDGEIINDFQSLKL